MRRNSFKRTCQNCDTEFTTCPSLNQKSCSISCERIMAWRNPTYRQRLVEAHKGQPSGMAGRKHRRDSILLMRTSHLKDASPQLRSNGYIYVYAPDHPLAVNGRIPEQVAVAERAI